MKSIKAGFTLIELMVSISILSIMMLFLYKSYASLNASNIIVKKESLTISKTMELKKVIFLDFSLAMANSIKVQNREKNEDFVSFQSSNSLHRRYNPYIAYIVKENRLYRLESLREFKNYYLNIDNKFDIDYLGEVESFRVYKSSDRKKELYLTHIDFKGMQNILLKTKVLNRAP